MMVFVLIAMTVEVARIPRAKQFVIRWVMERWPRCLAACPSSAATPLSSEYDSVIGYSLAIHL